MADLPFPDGFEPVGAPLGVGSTAVVWLARRTVDGRLSALKVWRRPLAGPRDRERFVREVRRHADLAATSGHLVSYTWAEPDADPPWIAVEPHGRALADVLAAEGRPPLAEGLAWGHDLLLGLAAVHRSGAVHRDVGVANVLVHEGRAKLCDLGLSTTQGAATEDRAAGTPRYVAPELLAGADPDARSDVYSAAVVLRDVLGEDLPAGLEQTVTAAASVRPGDRPVDAGAFAQRLARDARALGVELPAELPPGPRAALGPGGLERAVPRARSRPRPRPRARLVGGLVGGVAALAAGVVALSAGGFLDGDAQDAGGGAPPRTTVGGTATGAPDAATARADVAADGSPVVLPPATSGRCDQAVTDADPVARPVLTRADGVVVGEVRLFQAPDGGEVCAKLVKPEGSPLRGQETHLALTLCGQGGTCDHDWHAYRIDAGPVVVPAVDGCVSWRASVLDASGREWWVRDATGTWSCA